MINKHSTPCCALCHLEAKNDDSLELLNEYVEWIKRDALKQWTPGERNRHNNSGERAIQCITCPGEEDLERNLKKLKFRPIATFARRRGYAPGHNTMWFLNF